MALLWAAALTIALLVSTTPAVTQVAGATANDSCACAPALAECLSTLTTGRTCEPLLPVPRSELPSLIRPVGYNLIALRPGVHAYLDGAYTMLFVASGNKRRVVVVDLPDSPGSNVPNGTGTRLTAAFEEVLGGVTPWRVDLIYSHAHLDHIGAAARFRTYLHRTFPRASVRVWGTAEAVDLVRRSTTGRAVAPTHIVRRGGAVVHVERGLRLDLHIVGGHTREDLAIHVPPARGHPGVLHHVDVIFPGWVAPFTLALTSDVGRFRDVHGDLLELDWQVFSGGHLTRLGDRGDVETSHRFTVDLIDAAAAALASVDGPALLAAARAACLTRRRGSLATFGFFCGRPTPAAAGCVRGNDAGQVGCRLAGVDLMIRDSCFAALSYLLVDA
eukprot:TRINITY_DN2936_c0_g1_i5.p1 TRINITY_DN2936_c0_g1~~TRINITY_DN2936_c0_g1_i5.p1  ORF type:complete len:388 (-),score=121.42 TRINITY_DN2936_c0_g1_i5:252-1415(-)